MNVLSLFDGISCGRIALERCEIPVENYYAFEIYTNAIKISQKNYPDIIQCGDVFNSDFKEFTNIDLIIGGSPCTFWSKSKNHTAKQSKEIKPEGIGWDLFERFVLALKNVKHKYFLYENNYGISNEIIEAISNKLGVNPIMMDSSKVSAQKRKRLYWTNIPNIQQPNDKGILLKDIFEYDEKLIKTDPRILKTAVKTKNYIKYDLSNKGHFSQAFRLYYLNGKAPTVPKSRTESKINILIDENDYSTYKIISPLEAERLQTLPDGYTEGVPKTRRFEVIGNCWTVDIIVQFFKCLSQNVLIQTKTEVNNPK